LEAVWLWWQYQNGGDQNTLALLLQYNKEDVVNLKVLREKLGVETRQRRHTMPICSHSQLSTYEECPLKYKLLYRDRIKRDTEGVEGFPGDDGSRDSEEVL
jgi:hypothetical protein